ncbi:hypothetical protein GEAM_0753 [Ewingella americana ATCC 33852]|uniref:Uncharacterized protein n=1 Tax=Ewingella americana (strain ATCC 33852 / DSM 4580 / CCUG 14506 / JCM 5911 / LMG 7869 / NCTC 12157 / CDC 1468-78) TaxID=910964 RepID=A0A085GLA0_EWIA3|nr:hypothetical protein GEAM_0753 [Ewingella americana ATCC 33852]
MLKTQPWLRFFMSKISLSVAFIPSFILFIQNVQHKACQNFIS